MTEKQAQVESKTGVLRLITTFKLGEDAAKENEVKTWKGDASVNGGFSKLSINTVEDLEVYLNYTDQEYVATTAQGDSYLPNDYGMEDISHLQVADGDVTRSTYLALQFGHYLDIGHAAHFKTETSREKKTKHDKIRVSIRETTGIIEEVVRNGEDITRPNYTLIELDVPHTVTVTTTEGTKELTDDYFTELTKIVKAGEGLLSLEISINSQKLGVDYNMRLDGEGTTYWTSTNG